MSDKPQTGDPVREADLPAATRIMQRAFLGAADPPADRDDHVSRPGSVSGGPRRLV